MSSELFETLAWALMLAAWALANWLGRRKRLAREGSEPIGEAEPATSSSGEDSPPSRMEGLRDLVDELREALDGSMREVLPSEPVELPEPPVAAPAGESAEPPALAALAEAPTSTIGPPPVAARSIRPGRRAPRRAPGLAGDVVAQLRGGSRRLARAMVVAEVLAPPLALRADPGEGPGPGGAVR